MAGRSIAKTFSLNYRPDTTAKQTLSTSAA